MGWNNPPISWRELERQMSGRPMPDNSADNPEGDSAPGYSHKRPAYEPDEQLVKRPTGRSCRTRSCTVTATSASWTG